MLFSELFEIMVNKVTFAGFWGGDPPPWICPWLVFNWSFTERSQHKNCIPCAFVRHETVLTPWDLG